MGRVTYTGQPEESRFEFSKYPSSRFCRENTPSDHVNGNFRVLKKIEVSTDGGLKGAIVAITDMLDLRFLAEYDGTDVAVENCRFSSFTGVIVKSRSLSLENRDADPFDPKYANGVLHDMHTFQVVGKSYKTLFNPALPEKGLRLARAVSPRKDHVDLYILLRCDFHEWEQAFFLPVTNPYYAKVADDGSFVIKNVPPGRHRIVAWHPFAGRIEADIVVDEFGSAQVNFELQKTKGESQP